MSLAQMSEQERQVLYLLQEDLPDDPEPFDLLAEKAGMPVEEFFEIAREHLRCGHLRKVTALLNHYQAGFQANAMCVWDIPPERVDEAGRTMAGFDEVTHCYRRPVSEKWPYALFCMVHGRARQECEAVVRRIAHAVNPADHRMVYSARELKKRSLRLPL